MTPISLRTSVLRLLPAAFLIVAVLLCAIFMPAMAVTSLAACAAVIGLVTLARRAPSPLSERELYAVERAFTPTFVMATGPPLLVPLRT